MTLQPLRWLPQIIFTPTQLFSVEPGPILFFSLLLPQSLMFPLCLLCFAILLLPLSSSRLFLYHPPTQTCWGFFFLSYLSILHQGLLFFSIRGELIKCNRLNAQSRAYIAPPPKHLAPSCTPHRNHPLILNFFLYIMPSPLLCHFLCLQLCQKVSLCLPPSYSFSSIYIQYTHTYTPLIPLPAPTSSLTPFHPTLAAPHMKHGTAPSFHPISIFGQADPHIEQKFGILEMSAASVIPEQNPFRSRALTIHSCSRSLRIHFRRLSLKENFCPDFLKYSETSWCLFFNNTWHTYILIIWCTALLIMTKKVVGGKKQLLAFFPQENKHTKKFCAPNNKLKLSIGVNGCAQFKIMQNMFTSIRYSTVNKLCSTQELKANMMFGSIILT